MLSNIRLLLVSALSLALWSDVVIAKTVTILSFSADVPDNDVISSFSHQLENNLVSTQINVQRDCPDMIALSIKIYKDNQLVNTIEKDFSKPFDNIRDYNMCEDVETTDNDDQDCSSTAGEQIATNCDLGSLYTDLDAGNYITDVIFKTGDNEFSTAKIELKIED